MGQWIHKDSPHLEVKSGKAARGYLWPKSPDMGTRGLQPFSPRRLGLLLTTTPSSARPGPRKHASR